MNYLQEKQHQLKSESFWKGFALATVICILIGIMQISVK